ncbi:MAG TPA: 23S rRNA (adenine(2030)-N(6))-methyltransferase RlmJ [Xanthobacteraceae bacterium]
MNYSHAFHAGNFADTFKHATLARILVHLREKEPAFRVIDTHAGTGLYDLASEEAARTGEWRDGIGRLLEARLAPEIQELIAPYLAAVAAHNEGGDLRRYPGSPLIALSLLRPQDRLVACELEPRAARALAANLRPDARARAVAIDGWVALNAYVPPNERRGVVIIDPPYEDKNEYARLAAAVIAAHRKWATGTYLLWYPLKDRTGPDLLADALLHGGIGKILRAELELPPAAEPARLAGSGLIVINPPWRLAGEITSLLAALRSVLRPAPGGRAVVDWVAGET